MLPLQPRRGRARQGLAARQDAGRRVAAVRQPAGPVRLDVGVPGRPAAVHGRRDRAVARVERRRRASTGTALDGRAPPRRAGAGAGAQPGGRRVAGAVGARPRAGRVPVARRRRRRPLACTPSCAGRPTGARSWPASPTSRRCRARATASGCRGRGEWQVLLDTNATYFGGTGYGGVAGGVGGRRRAAPGPAGLGVPHPPAARRALARRHAPRDATSRAVGPSSPPRWRSASPSACSASRSACWRWPTG